MKKLAFLLGLSVLALASCKKDSGSTTSLSPSNSSAVSSALQIWHGTNIAGAPPVGTNSGSIVIDSTSQEISSYKGGYAIIQPNIISGTIAGYYVHIKGANNYFNIDYSNNVYRPALATSARAAVGVSSHPKHSVFGQRPTSASSDPNDSMIVIQLPAGIDTGTFCIEYWAYDGYGNISDSVEVCITIDQLGASGGSSWAGNWLLTGLKLGSGYDNYSSTFTVDTSWVYNLQDTTNVLDYVSDYYCVDGHLSDDSGYYHGYSFYGGNTLIQGSSTTTLTIPEYVWYSNLPILTLSSNGAWQFGTGNIGQVNKYFSGSSGVDLRIASCSDITYTDQIDSSSSSTTGGWSYNATTNMFIVVSKDSGSSVETTDVDQYLVESKTPTTFVLAGVDSSDIGEKLQFTKQ